jgi:hypothetical protein
MTNSFIFSRKKPFSFTIERKMVNGFQRMRVCKEYRKKRLIDRLCGGGLWKDISLGSRMEFLAVMTICTSFDLSIHRPGFQLSSSLEIKIKILKTSFNNSAEEMTERVGDGRQQFPIQII